MCIAISITNNPDWRLPHDVQADRCGQPARAPTAYGYGKCTRSAEKRMIRIVLGYLCSVL